MPKKNIDYFIQGHMLKSKNRKKAILTFALSELEKKKQAHSPQTLTVRAEARALLFCSLPQKF